MSNSLTRTYTFANGGVADGGQVDSEISNIVNTINNADAGTTTWTAVKATTLTAVTSLIIGTNTFGYLPWTAFTPVMAGFGTITEAFGWYRHVGDTMEGIGRFTAATLTHVAGTMTVPAGLAIDTSKLPATKTTAVGEHRREITSGVGTQSIAAPMFYDGSTAGFIFMGYAVANNAFTKNAPDDFAASNDSFSFRFAIPISGW